MIRRFNMMDLGRDCWRVALSDGEARLRLLRSLPREGRGRDVRMVGSTSLDLAFYR